MIIEHHDRPCHDCENADEEHRTHLAQLSDEDWRRCWKYNRALSTYSYSWTGESESRALCYYHATPKDGTEPPEYIEAWQMFWLARTG